MGKRRLKEIKPGMAIHCQTEEEAKELLGYLHKRGYCWSNGKSLENITQWGEFKGETCYSVEESGNTISFDRSAYYETHPDKYNYIQYTDLILPELTAEEVWEGLNDIHEEEMQDFFQLPCLNRDELIIGAKWQELVELVTKHKADHEKKAPELEWVDVCRIIQVYLNGRKECVHEEELTYEPGFQASAVEEVFGRYIAEHEGEYFAVAARVCRVKEQALKQMGE